jgi:hypothetical protein
VPSRVLCLSFARNPVASIRVPLLGSDGQGANSRTMWAYIDPSFVEEQREIYQRALAHRSRGLVKPHGNDGPFRPLYVAIFLAIAQHRKRVGQFYRGRGDDKIHRVCSFNMQKAVRHNADVERLDNSLRTKLFLTAANHETNASEAQ